MLVFTHIMVRQKLNLHFHGQIGKEACSCINIFLIGINTFYKGYAHNKRFAQMSKQTDIVKDDLIGNTRILAMFLTIHQLNINEKQIALLCHPTNHLLRSIERSVNCPMEAHSPQFLKQRNNILHQRLTATQGHTSPTVQHYVTLLLHLTKQFVNIPFPATHL